jgi:hypothetical protein
MAARIRLPMLQLPPRGLWGRSGQPTLAAMEDRIAAPMPGLDPSRPRPALSGRVRARQRRRCPDLVGTQSPGSPRSRRFRPSLAVFREVKAGWSCSTSPRRSGRRTTPRRPCDSSGSSITCCWLTRIGRGSCRRNTSAGSIRPTASCAPPCWSTASRRGVGASRMARPRRVLHVELFAIGPPRSVAKGAGGGGRAAAGLRRQAHRRRGPDRGRRQPKGASASIVAAASRSASSARMAKPRVSCGGLERRLVQQAAHGGGDRVGARIGRQGQAGAAMDDAGGVVVLVAAHRQAQQRDAGHQRPQGRAMAGMGDEQGRALQQVAVRRAADDGDIAGASNCDGSRVGPVVTTPRTGSWPRAAMIARRTGS